MAKTPKTNYMKHCDYFTADVKESHAAEYALMPFNGAFVILHKRAFDVPGLAMNNILFGDCIFKGRGTAALQHVTSGTLWPMFPTKPTITSTGEVSEPKQGEPFMDRAIVLAGGEHLDSANEWFQISTSDEELVTFADTVRTKQRSDAVRGNPYGAAEVLNYTASNEEHVQTVFDEYFSFVPQGNRKDFLLYFFADHTTMIAYALMNFNETISPMVVRRGRVDAQQVVDDNVYVHPKTFRAIVDNKRLNLTDDPEHMCYFRPVVHGSNEVMLYQERHVLSGDIQDPVVLEYNKVHGTILSQDSSKYSVMKCDTYMATQVVSEILNTYTAPVAIQHAYPSAGAALNTRLNFIRTAMVRQQKFRSDIPNKDAIAAGSVGRAILNSVSPSVIRSYRDDADHSNIMRQHGSSSYGAPWLPTFRSTALCTAHRAKTYLREMYPEVSAETLDAIEMDAAMASSLIHLTSIVDLNNVYNAEQFEDRHNMVAKAGDTSKKSVDDYRSHQIKMGGCELGKELDSAVQIIFAHFHYDIARFKRYFLQNSWHFLGGMKGIKLSVDRLPVKDDIFECAPCGGVPFYERGDTNAPRHCMCYILLRVYAKLTHMDVTDAYTAKKVSDLYMTELYKDPYAREMTSMKILLCCRVVEPTSKYGPFGSLKIKHANKVDGFKLRKKHEEKYALKSAKNTPLVNGPISGNGDTPNIPPPMDTGRTGTKMVEVGDNKDDDSYKEALEVAVLVRRILAKSPTILSENQSKIVENDSKILQYMSETCRRPKLEGIEEAQNVGQVRFYCHKAVKKQLLSDPYIQGDRTTIDPFAAEDEPYHVDGTVGADEHGDPSGWNNFMMSATSSQNTESTFSWEPPAKRRKIKKPHVLGEKMRNFVRAATLGYLSREGSDDRKALGMISCAEMGPKHAALLEEWRNSDSDTQNRYGKAFIRAFLAVMLRHPSKNEPSADDHNGAIGRAIEEYLESTALSARAIHAAVAEELSMTPEELDTAALRDIVHYNSLNGELSSWIDPISGDPQVTARCERHTQYLAVRHIVDVRSMSKEPETIDIHPLQIEKYTSGASAENGPHSVRVSMALPLYTPQVLNICGDSNEPPAMSLNPTAAAATDVVCVHDLPIKMKVGVGLTAFDLDGCTKPGLGSKGSADRTASGGNQADYCTVPVSAEMDNGGLFKPFPLLANTGPLVTGRSKARSVNDLANDLRQKSLKMHRLGLNDSIDPTCMQDGICWMMDYLEQRRDINSQPSLPSLIQNLMMDMNAICGIVPAVYVFILEILKRHVREDVTNTLNSLKGVFMAKLYTREILLPNLRACFARRPELLGAMNVICACAETYGVRHPTENPIFDREYERDVGMVTVMIAGSLRLFVGRSGGDKVLRSQTERQTGLMPIRVTYADEMLSKGKAIIATTYADREAAHCSQILTAATVVSYPSRDGAKRFTRFRGGDTFNRRTIASGMSRMGIKTDEKEVTLIKKPMVHFPNPLRKSVEDNTEEVLSSSSLDTILRMYHTGEITLTRLAKHLIGALVSKMELNDDGWLNVDTVCKEQILDALNDGKFATDSVTSKQLFEEELFPKLFSVMCGEKDSTTQRLSTGCRLETFMDYEDDDVEDEYEGENDDI